MRDRSYAGEAGYLALIEAAEFRHVDEQAHGGGLGNARYAHEDRQSRGEIRIPLAQAEKVVLLRFCGERFSSYPASLSN
jgi:hypothetical protein